MIASMITTFSTLCPNLLEITLRHLPLDQSISVTASSMLLACDRNILRKFDVDCLLTDSAREVLYQLPNLRKLSSVHLGNTLLPPVILPNLVEMHVMFKCGHKWLQNLNGATLNKLTSVSFYDVSRQVGGFLEEFKGFALATFISTQLSRFKFSSKSSWDLNYSSLLGFKQLTELAILTPCRTSCSSTVDDDIIAKLARAMLKLKILQLGSKPCQTPTGVTVKGLVELACHCINLSILRVHIQVNSLVQIAVGDIPTSPSNAESATPRVECALTTPEVGDMTVQEGSVLTVALALSHIFPRINKIKYTDPRWENVQDTVKLSKRLSNQIGALASFSGEAGLQYPKSHTDVPTGNTLNIDHSPLSGQG